MKNIIISIAIAIVMISLLVFINDANDLQREKEKISNTAGELTDAMALNINEYEYGQGYLIFDYENAVKSSIELLKKNLRLNDEFKNENAYWKGPIKIKAYFFDDSMKMTLYDGEKISIKGDFSYDTDFLLPDINKKVYIKNPSVIVIINAGKPYIRHRAFKKQGDILVYSMYEYFVD